MGRPRKKEKRILMDDGQWHYICIKCESYKPEKEMGINRNRPFGIDRYCRPCKKDYQSKFNKNNDSLIKKGDIQYGTAWVEPMGRHLTIRGNNRKKDIEDLTTYFINMGYDVTKPIHEQFGKRIEDKYGVILEFDEVHYSKKDVS